MKTKIPQLTLLSLSLLSTVYGAGSLSIENAQVISGDVSFDGLQSNTATITQRGNKAIVDYDRFDVGRGGAVNFIQPSEQAAILNRIKGGDPSFLNGTITGNGQIYFVNPAGVTFGANSIIRADTFMAVAGQIANEDFMAGQLQFDLQGTVSNYGLIETLNDVALLGDRVINAGDIVSRSGVSILSAGDEVLLRENGSTLAVQLTSIDSVPKDGVAIDNSGLVEGDEVMFSAGDAYSLALRQSGTVRAAKSANLYADGGAIEVSGQVSARSAEGAGRIEIGGTDLGGPGAPIASEVLISETAVIDASAQVDGEGGDIVIYSSGDTTMLGAINAQSMGDSDGGHVEVSGSHVDFGTSAWDISIGKGGSFLIDPTNVIIDQPTATGYEGVLQGGADVTVTTIGTADTGAELGDITLNGTIDNAFLSGVGDFTLEAAGSIFVNGYLDNGDGNITFDAQNDITVSHQVATGALGTPALIQLLASNGAVTFNGIGSLQLFGDANAQVVAQNLVNNTGAGAINQGGNGFWQVVLQNWNTAASPNQQIYNGLVSVDKAQFGSTGNAAAITKNEYHFVDTPVIGIQVNNDSKTYGDAIASETYQTYVVDGDTFVNAALNAGAFTQDDVGNTIIDNPLNVQYSTAGSPLAADAADYTDLTLTGLESQNGYTYDVTAGTFTVHKRALEVTADDRTRIYGEELVLGTNEFTFLDTHKIVPDAVLPNGDQLTDVVLGSDNNHATNTRSDVNEYAGEVTVGALSGAGFNPDNYEVTRVAGKLTVTKRQITVAALEQTKTYGDIESFGDPADDLSLNGALFQVNDLGDAADHELPNGEAIIFTEMRYLDDADQPLIDLGGSEAENVGTRTSAFKITGLTGNTASGDPSDPKAFDVNNYDITYERGDYTIVKRSISVTALPQAKQYGEQILLQGDAVNGFEVRDLHGGVDDLELPNSEVITTVVVDSAGDLHDSTTQGQGTYTGNLSISPTDGIVDTDDDFGFNKDNYEITYVAGDFKIDPRDVTLTASTQHKVYGNTMVLNDQLFVVADQGNDLDMALPNGETIDSVTFAASSVLAAGSTRTDADIHINEIKIDGQTGSAPLGGPATYDPANYNFTYVDGNLNVAKRAITVTALEQTKVYGNVESFGGTVDSLDGSQFDVTDPLLPQLPNGESIVSTTMSYVNGVDLGASTTEDAGTTVAEIKIDTLIGNAAVSGGAKAFDENNYQINKVNGNYTIDKREIRVTALEQRKQYGDQLVLQTDKVNAFDVWDKEGNKATLPNGETIDTVFIASADGYDLSTTQAAGTYNGNLSISAPDAHSLNFNEDNYIIEKVDGALIIDPREVTLTALDQSKLYGDTMTLDGKLFTIADKGVRSNTALPNGETVESVSFKSSTVATLTVDDAGLYENEIKIDGLVNVVGSAPAASPASFDNANYAFTLVDGDLLIKKRPITLTALDQTKTYGEGFDLTQRPEFTLQDVSLGASLPNGELINSVDLLSAADNGGTTSDAGSYSDDLSIAALHTSTDFKLSNYDPTYVKGDFQVDRRSITISLLDQVKPYGEPFDFDPEAFTLFDPLSGTSNLPNAEQVVQVLFQAPSLASRPANPENYLSLLQGRATIGSNGFKASNYSITFNPANLRVSYINDIEKAVVPGEAYLDQQEYVYSGSPFTQLFNPTLPISENGFSSVVERPEWTSMTPQQQAWVFAQVAQMRGSTQLSEELVEYLIVGAKAQ
jgi:filamentous hemagglutinin family protein